MNVTTMLNLFGNKNDREKNKNLCHQDLLEQGELTRFEDLPMGSFVMFVSHQWNGLNHPDPDGRKMDVLTNVLRDLRDQRHKKVETAPFHVLVYKQSTVTKAKEWNELLTNAYIWYDWFSQPQPSCGKSKKEIVRSSVQAQTSH